jgi:ribosome recycling factor
MLDELYKKTDEHMHKTLENLSHELSGIRTGKASPAILPWDRSMMGEIEKAIQASDLGLNPQNDGSLIRLPIPPLTEERRRDLVKVVKRIGEDARVAVRNVRRDANEKLKKLEKEHELSQDEMHSRQEAIQKLTDQFVKKVDEVVVAKEKEVLEL